MFDPPPNTRRRSLTQLIQRKSQHPTVDEFDSVVQEEKRHSTKIVDGKKAKIEEKHHSTTNENSESEKCDDKPKTILKDVTQLIHNLELMHDRCIARNLRAAGLGGFDVDQDDLIYGVLDPNATMRTGETMLTATILYIREPDRQQRFVSILINEGADMNVQDAEGRTALMHACIRGAERIAKVLIRQSKTDLLLRDNDGNTALMHAAALGSTKILKCYFKMLRKREKRQFGGRQSSLENKEPPQDGKEQDASSTNSSKPSIRREYLRLLSGDDPLDYKNARGKTARMLADENGRVECVQLLNDEKLRRVKEMNKRLNSINHHHRGESGSPALLNSAKRSAKKYFNHYGSFDSVYYNQEDQSDDELVLTSTTTIVKPGDHPHHRQHANKGGSEKAHDKQNSKALIIAEQHQLEHQPHQGKKVLLGRLHKRFRSNPDLFRVRANASTHSTGGNYADSTKDDEEDNSSDDEETENSSVKNTPSQKQSNASTATSSSEKKTTKVNTDSLSYMPPPTHQPIIGGVHNQPHTHTHKRNLTDKLMHFLRRRPKYFVPSSASDMALSAGAPTSPGTGHWGKKASAGRMKYSGSVGANGAGLAGGYSNFSSIEREEFPEQTENGKTGPGAMRKGLSHTDVRSDLQEELSQTTASGALADVKSKNAKQRRSIDVSFANIFRHNAPRSESVTPQLALADGKNSAGKSDTAPKVPNDNEKPTNLPPLNSTDKQQRQQMTLEKGAWPAHEDAWDSGLASSGNSRPVSADSTTSQQNV